jgi:hypothetical protein
MTVRLIDEIIVLEGDCYVEEAETLTVLLQTADRVVDLNGCRMLHGAVLQVLLAFAPAISGEPGDPFLKALVAPALSKAMEEMEQAGA